MFNEVEKRFRDIEKNLALTREFLTKHREKIEQHTFRAYGWDNEIVFYGYDQDSKAIARAFGSEGWTRQHDSYSCGAINWHKEVDGIKLKIENAENIKPKLIEAVKL